MNSLSGRALILQLCKLSTCKSYIFRNEILTIVKLQGKNILVCATICSKILRLEKIESAETSGMGVKLIIRGKRDRKNNTRKIKIPAIWRAL